MIATSKISPLQLHRSRTLPSGMVESNHLSSAYYTQPEKMESILAFAFGDQDSTAVLNMMTGGLKNTRFVNNREYSWELIGQSERALSVSRDSDGGATPGYGGMPFRIYFNEKGFDPTDVLLADDGTQVRVIEEPFPDGSDIAYTVVLNDPSVLFLDPANVTLGARFSKEWSSAEEYSIKGGGDMYSAPTELKNQLTTLRKTYRVTRSAATDVLIMEVNGGNGKSSKYWTKVVEWTAMRNWFKEIERNLVYSTFAKNATGEAVVQGQNKRPVFSGAGMRQQISPANVRYYTKLTYEILESFLVDLSYAASRNGVAKFVALTGKMGMVEFNNAIQNRVKALNLTITNSGTFITGSGQELTLQGQFTTVKFLNGIELTVREFPPYDSLFRNRQLHPVSQKPIESYRFTLLNFGTVAESTKNNIRKVAKAKSENAMWHVSGSIDPMDVVPGSINTNRATGLDGYEVHFLAEIGLQVQDPTSCGELIMDLNY